MKTNTKSKTTDSKTREQVQREIAAKMARRAPPPRPARNQILRNATGAP